MSGDAPLDDLEADKLPANPFLLLLPERVPADELLVQIGDPSVYHLVGGHGLAHLVPEEHHPRLEAERVPGSQPRRFQAVRIPDAHQQVPDLADPPRLGVHLEAVLPGVAAARDKGGIPATRVSMA